MPSRAESRTFKNASNVSLKMFMKPPFLGLAAWGWKGGEGRGGAVGLVRGEGKAGQVILKKYKIRSVILG